MTRSKFNSKFRMSSVKSISFVLVFTLALSLGVYFLGKNFAGVGSPDDENKITEKEAEEIKDKYDLVEPNQDLETEPSEEPSQNKEDSQIEDKQPSEGKPQETKKSFDKRAQKGLMPGIDENAFENIDETVFVYIINKNMSIKKSGEEANVLIYNPKENKYNFSLKLNHGNKTIFETELLAPGSYIEKAVLNDDFEKGKFTLEAVLSSYDLENLEPCDVYTESITLNVEK